MPKTTSKNQDHYISTTKGWINQNNTVDEITFDKAFPYDFERHPINYGDEHLQINGTKYYVLECSDNGQTVGKPIPETYQHLTNERFWEIIQNSVGGTDAIIENAGTFKNRGRRFVTVQLGTDMDKFYVGNREFKNRFCLLDSIDMSSSLYGVNTSTCIICQNSFSAAMSDRSGLFRFKVRHSKNMIVGIENMEKGIESFIGVSKQFKHALEKANTIPVKHAEANQLFTGWIAKDNAKDKVLSTRSKNIVNRLGELFVSGKGNEGQTLLDAFSAVTDFYSHESSGGKDKDGFRTKQNESSQFGTGNRVKQNFYNELFSSPHETSRMPNFKKESFDSLKERGREVMAQESVVMN